MKAVSATQMKKLDQRAIKEAGIPGMILMDRAGKGAATHIAEYLSLISSNHVKRVVMLAGKGNNGGDIYATAKYLKENTAFNIHIFSVCAISELKGDARTHAKQLPKDIHLEIRTRLIKKDFAAGDIIVDGLLGTGAKGPLRPPYDNWIALINSLELPVISLDLPSGLNGSDGTVGSEAVKADMTIVMGLPKSGLLLARGPELAGRIRFIEIGIPEKFIRETKSDLNMVCAPDLKNVLGRIPGDTHKKARGTVLVVGGSKLYPGAPYLSAEAALRAGAGLVVLAVPESLGENIQRSRSLILRKIPDGGSGYFMPESLPELKLLAQMCDSVVTGPGMSTEKSIYPVIEYFCNSEKPVVFDADALNMIAKYPERLLPSPNSILTPHPGEMRRLLASSPDGGAKAERIAQAKQLALMTGATVVLKGRQTITASPGEEVYVNSSGSPALATAGSGDVLSGILGAFLAQGVKPQEAAYSAVYIHGLSGEMSENGIRGTTADDLLDIIPAAMKNISPFA